MAIANSLPEGAPLRLPSTISAHVSLADVEAFLRSEPLQTLDAASPGTLFFHGLEAGKTHWLDGFWGDNLEEAGSDDGLFFRVNHVGLEIPSATPLLLIHSDDFW